MLSTDAWIEKVDSLAWTEVLCAQEPSLEILDYWPTATITVWRAKRQEPAPSFDKRLVEISSNRRRAEVSQRHATPQTNSTKSLQLLRNTGFYLWVCSVHGASQYLDAICGEAKQGESEGFTATLDELRSSMLRAIGLAHVGTNRLQDLLLRLRVLEHRFRNIIDGTVVMDLHAPLSADFTFLTDLTGLTPSSLAKVLSCGCFRLYEEITGIDIRRETERSRKMAEWANDLQWKGEECVAAGLENEVHRLAECLWKLGDHHSSRALEASYEHSFGDNQSRDYWQRCKDGNQTGGVLYSFRNCKSLAEKLRGSRVIPGLVGDQAPEKERAFLADVILKYIEWGDVQQPSLASFRASALTPDTSDKENRLARGSGSSSVSESDQRPRTIKHTRSLHRLAGLFKIPSSSNND